MNVTRKHEAALQVCIDALTTLIRKTDSATVRDELEREVRQLRTWNRTLPRLREWPIEVQARVI